MGRMLKSEKEPQASRRGRSLAVFGKRSGIVA